MTIGFCHSLSLLTLLGVFYLPALASHAQTTAFAYQGRLNDSGNPASGLYDLRFSVLDGPGTNANQIGAPLTNSAVMVTNGLFETLLDFGNVFTGTNYWLDISVCASAGGAFVELAPRQSISPVPYAIYASEAGDITGTLPLAQLPGTVLTNNAIGVNLIGTFSGSGGALTNLNALALAGVISPQNINSPGGSFGTTYNYTYQDISSISGWWSNNFNIQEWTPTFHTGFYGPPGYITNYVYFGGGLWADRNGYADVTNSTYDDAHQYIEFEECSTNVGIIVKGDSQDWQIIVDGVPELSQHVGESTAASGDEWTYTYTFPDRRTRHIAVYGGVDFGGIFCATNEGGAFSPVKSRPTTCVIVGDSYVDGPGSIGKYFFFNTKNVNVVQDTSGGTGYIAPGPSSPDTNYVNRLINVTSVNPDYVVVTGGINDPLTNGTDNPSYPPGWTLANAVTNYLMALTNAVPNARIFVQGPWYNQTPNASILQADLIVSNACAIMGIPHTSALYPTPLIYGSYQNPASGNAAILIYPGNSHPNEPGSMFLGNSLYQSVVNAYPNFDQANAGIVNLLPSSLRTVNSPVNGYALRYTNGGFYWAP